MTATLVISPKTAMVKRSPASVELLAGQVNVGRVPLLVPPLPPKRKLAPMIMSLLFE